MGKWARRHRQYVSDARRVLLDSQGRQIGRVYARTALLMQGQQAETLLEAMIGRKLSDVISRPGLGRAVTVVKAYNDLNGETWMIECSGSIILPERIALKRERDAERQSRC